MSTSTVALTRGGYFGIMVLFSSGDIMCQELVSEGHNVLNGLVVFDFRTAHALNDVTLSVHQSF